MGKLKKVRYTFTYPINGLIITTAGSAGENRAQQPEGIVIMHEQEMAMSPRERGEAIRILITGGTFDKEYDPLRGELGFSSTHLPEILRYSRCTYPVTLEILELKDSLYMTDEDRRSILERCRDAQESRIIITHGTDTMTDTAAVLGREDLHKHIVLTGAMVPYAVIGSDSVFNLGCSIMAVQLISRGVYICMNGRIFPFERVRKNTSTGVFEDL